jgi:hypothetical protein
MIRFRAMMLAFCVVISIGAMPVIARSERDEGSVTQNGALLSAVVVLGGDVEHFSAARFRKAIETEEGERRLTASVGVQAIGRFDRVFTFVVMDSLETMRRHGVKLPAPDPDPKNVRAVAAALYRAGLQDGSFTVERLFDVLFSPGAHAHAMLSVARTYGVEGETAYHVVFAKLVSDIGSHS